MSSLISLAELRRLPLLGMPSTAQPGESIPIPNGVVRIGRSSLLALLDVAEAAQRYLDVDSMDTDYEDWCLTDLENALARFDFGEVADDR